jgi:glycosyltransferase involved in cell wall biosynthesis
MSRTNESMRVIHAFNTRKVWGGEDRMVELIDRLLVQKGIRAFKLRKKIGDLGEGASSKLRAFFSGTVSKSAFNEMTRLIQSQNPDLVHVHNLYPQLTLSVITASHRAGIPVVKHVHDFSLTCPVTTHLHEQKVCTRCIGGHEHWCAIRNCRGNLPESLAYAMRSAWVRFFRIFEHNVSLFIVLTNFAKKHLCAQGFCPEKIVVLPNPVFLPEHAAVPSRGRFAAFVGRLSPEKGIETLTAAASMLPEVPIRIAGEGKLKKNILSQGASNVFIEGMLTRQALRKFYNQARFLVVPSIWYEGCPMVILEAMGWGIPIIASRIGGLAEIIDEGETGFLFEPGNVEDLADKMKRLWNDPDLCARMGMAGRKKAVSQYSEEIYYRRLMNIYEKAAAFKCQPQN